ncbi:uncharacterized protein LOC118198581 [Stegodyphus dumicola]|uniref:uncharacterized protein LOC118198581 n=1 Tax=Stegodyphus dumicola TaxID=202533 RepID=UPI0015B1F4C4|nr:uncharacterized protein LOC118198581 [Stegodyphus dumicola]
MKKSCGKLSFWRSKARSFFKILMVVGFILQSAKFLEMYLKYPSFLQLDVEEPQEVEFPAFTVCNLNEIRSTPYCARYPERCGSAETTKNFCEFPEYCRLVNDTKKQVPLHPISHYNLSRYEQQLFGHQWNGLVVDCVIETDGNEEKCNETPILVPALSHSETVAFNCFMMYSLYGQPNGHPKRVPISTVIRLHMNLEIGEYHPSHLSRGAQISVHSPYHVPSPMSEGWLLNLGNIYRFYTRLTRQILLPPPYKSNCRDYMKEWKANGGMGPMTQKMCKVKCKLDKSLYLYGCADPFIDYPHNETICDHEIPNFHASARSECAEKCSMSCRIPVEPRLT